MRYTRSIVIWAWALSLVGLITWAPGHAELIYSEDFTVDPGWSSNDATRNYCDETNGWYHWTIQDNANDWAYVGVPSYSGGDFRLQFDVYVDHSDWASNFRFGLWDDSAAYGYPNQYVMTHYAVDGDDNHRIFVESSDVTWHGYFGWFQDDVWYTNALEYSDAAKQAMLRVTKRDTHELVWEGTGSAGADLLALDGLALSSVGDVAYWPAQATGYLDNVTLEAPPAVPEPASCALLACAVGGVGLALKRRRRAT